EELLLLHGRLPVTPLLVLGQALLLRLLLLECRLLRGFLLLLLLELLLELLVGAVVGPRRRHVEEKSHGEGDDADPGEAGAFHGGTPWRATPRSDAGPKSLRILYDGTEPAGWLALLAIHGRTDPLPEFLSALGRRKGGRSHDRGLNGWCAKSDS